MLTPIGALALVRPEEARVAILRAMRLAGAHRARAAEALGCSRATFARLVARLGMEGELERLEREALRNGTHHGRLGGRPRKEG